VVGTAGRIELTNPFHPGPGDTLTWVRTGEDPVVETLAGVTRSFTDALVHIDAALAGAEPPRHLAVTDSLPTAVLLDELRAARLRR
jgi:hypothetical protein